MNFFEQRDNELIFRENGETVIITPWGENSLRVRSAILSEPVENSAALLDVPKLTGEIHIEDTCASIKNGNITARLTVQPWGNALQISFYNEKGELLLQEIPNGNALTKKARHFTPLAGDSFRLKASFVSNPNEKIYGISRTAKHYR